jgi:hypothetical protein
MIDIGAVAVLKVAVTWVSAVIVKAHVLRAHAAAALVPPEKRPGGPPGTGLFAARRMAVPDAMANVHCVADAELHTAPVGITATAPVFGPAMLIVRVTFWALARAAGTSTVMALSAAMIAIRTRGV